MSHFFPRLSLGFLGFGLMEPKQSYVSDGTRLDVDEDRELARGEEIVVCEVVELPPSTRI